MLTGWQNQLTELTGAKCTILVSFEGEHSGIEYGDICEIVCNTTGIPHDKLRMKTRKREIVVARQLVAYYSKYFTNMTLNSVGLDLGGRDHTTIIHARERIRNLIETGDPYVLEKVQQINERIKALQESVH